MFLMVYPSILMATFAWLGQRKWIFGITLGSDMPISGNSKIADSGMDWNVHMMVIPELMVMLYFNDFKIINFQILVHRIVYALSLSGSGIHVQAAWSN